MAKLIKVTDENGQTKNGMQWGPGITNEATRRIFQMYKVTLTFGLTDSREKRQLYPGLNRLDEFEQALVSEFGAFTRTQTVIARAVDGKAVQDPALEYGFYGTDLSTLTKLAYLAADEFGSAVTVSWQAVDKFEVHPK